MNLNPKDPYIKFKKISSNNILNAETRVSNNSQKFE